MIYRFSEDSYVCNGVEDEKDYTQCPHGYDIIRNIFGIKEDDVAKLEEKDSLDGITAALIEKNNYLVIEHTEVGKEHTTGKYFFVAGRIVSIS